MASQREARLSRRFVNYLRSEGAFVFKVHGGPMQKRGIPDINFCYRSLYGAIETKMPGNARPTELQAKAVRDIQAAGGYAAVCTSIEQVRELIVDMKGDAEDFGIPMPPSMR